MGEITVQTRDGREIVGRIVTGARDFIVVVEAGEPVMIDRSNIAEVVYPRGMRQTYPAPAAEVAQ